MFLYVSKSSYAAEFQFETSTESFLVWTFCGIPNRWVREDDCLVQKMMQWKWRRTGGMNLTFELAPLKYLMARMINLNGCEENFILLHRKLWPMKYGLYKWHNQRFYMISWNFSSGKVVLIVKSNFRCIQLDKDMPGVWHQTLVDLPHILIFEHGSFGSHIVQIICLQQGLWVFVWNMWGLWVALAKWKLYSSDR